MFLADPSSTPFDLRFSVAGIPVRVHPLFWLMTIVLGWNITQSRVLSENGMVELALWVAACFLSILLHELGHVWMGNLFGARSHIVLHGMGGLAVGAGNCPHHWQRILVSAAGPVIQLLLWGGLVLLIRYLFGPGEMTPIRFLIGLLLMINLYWPILNLLPILPLDGGQILRDLAMWISPRKGLLFALYVSFLVSAALAINALAGINQKAFIPYAPVGQYTLILFGMFAVGSWQMIQAER
ncbi:MAG: site-2 protease family protein, partial [Gemmataceae bacterium]